MPSLDLTQLKSIYADSRADFFAFWQKFISFKSVSTNPAFEDDCRACATWLVSILGAMGLTSELLETSSKPVVLAKWEKIPGAPHILFYGHYDVQPPEPLELWESDPFHGSLRGNRMYARGAQDNKGQVSFFLSALKTLIEHDALPCNLTVLIEGEEETGSFGLDNSLNSWRDRLCSDVLMVCDTGALHPGVPCITMGLRGIFHVEVKVSGPRGDLHSGVFGGTVRNPAVELCRLIACLHNSDGAIAVPGFYDDIPAPTEQEKQLLSTLQVDLECIAQKLGCELAGGENNFSFHERRGLRPTLEINGMLSGYTGPGSKTIIPSYATAKITGRTVRGQHPERSMKLLIEYLKSRSPIGVATEITASFVGGPAIAVDPASSLVEHVRQLLAEIGDGRVEVTWEGGSIPIVARLAEQTGATPLLVGFGLDEDCMHAPNESFSIDQFEHGFLYVALALQRLRK